MARKANAPYKIHKTPRKITTHPYSTPQAITLASYERNPFIAGGKGLGCVPKVWWNNLRKNHPSEFHVFTCIVAYTSIQELFKGTKKSGLPLQCEACSRFKHQKNRWTIHMYINYIYIYKGMALQPSLLCKSNQVSAWLKFFGSNLHVSPTPINWKAADWQKLGMIWPTIFFCLFSFGCSRLKDFIIVTE